MKKNYFTLLILFTFIVNFLYWEITPVFAGKKQIVEPRPATKVQRNFQFKSARKQRKKRIFLTHRKKKRKSPDPGITQLCSVGRKNMAKIHIGMSGWKFDGWRGDFYPKGLAQNKELSYAAQQVNSIEVNATFYSFQKPATFQKWYDETPEEFCFSIKAPQYITHVRRLKEVEGSLCNFLASGLFCLKEKLGPILWQFPPNVMLKDDRFEKFLKILPYDSKSAARLAKKHSPRLEGRTVVKMHGDYPIRHAFEFRHPSFMDPGFIEMMREYGVAMVFAHSGLKSPYMEDLTSDFIYARMHGQEDLYKKGYPDQVLSWWADRVSCWSQGQQPSDAQCVSLEKPSKIKREAFIYFDTEAKEYAPYDALNLSKLLKNQKSQKSQKSSEVQEKVIQKKKIA